MTETRDQRIERWAHAIDPWAFSPDRHPEGLSAQTRRRWAREAAEAIDASNTSAGLVLVDRALAAGMIRAFLDVSAMSGVRDQWVEDAQALRKEIEG